MPSTRVWVKQGLHSHRSAQVLLVPLGNIPPDVYAKYCEILRRFSTIPMQNLTAPGDWSRQHGPLKHFNWSEGCFNFHFIDKETTDGGASDWEDYQAYRRVLGAIGIVHFPSCYGAGGADFRELEKQFHAMLAEYKHVHATRIFAFGHSFEQGDYPDILDPQRDIVFPPEQEFEGGGSTTELHMAVSLYDVAVSLIKNLAAEVKTCRAAMSSPSAAVKAVAALRGKTDSAPPLTSWYDREEGVSDSRSAKRKPGRLHKWIADTCLLLGSPKDALEHYSQSMSDTKMAHDPLWHAGCLEGYAACLAAMSDADHPTVHGDQALALVRDMAKDRELEKGGQEGNSTWTMLAEAVISEKCEEALSVFSRYPLLGALEVELCFKTARFHACAQPSPRWDRALAALLRALSVPDMPMHVQLERSIEAAVLCESMGLKRKAALFAHLSAMLCSDFETWNTAHLLARMAGEGYGALLPAPSPSSGKAEVLLRQAEPGGWLVLRKYLLQWLLAVSARCGDARASSEYFAGLTELMAVLEEERRKADQYTDGALPGEGSSPPAPLTVEALGNAPGAPTGLPPPAPPSSARDNKVSWGERMMRRTTTDGPQISFPLTPSGISFGNGFTGGSSTFDSFLSTGSTRSPSAPSSPINQRFEGVVSDILHAAGQPQPASARKGRKMSLPKAIGRKMAHSRGVGGSISGVYRNKEASASGAMGAPLLESGGGGIGASGGAGTTGAIGGLTAVAYRAALTLEEQWETLSEMAQCTSRLSPEDSARVQLPGIPRLESARLLHFGGPLALLPGDGGVSLEEGASAPSSARQAPSSALFYNPFDHTGDLAEVFDEEEGVDEWEEYGSGEAESSAPRVRDQGKGGREGRKSNLAPSSKTATARGKNRVSRRGGSGGGGGAGMGTGPGPGAELPARWVAGETGKVVARFSNPLRVPLELECVKAVLDGGARVQAFPTSVVLPPEAKFHEVVMFVKPLEGGHLVLKGVSVEVLSLVIMCRVDKWGKGVVPRPRLPSPRTYESLRATFRRPQELVTTETVDIAAAAAAAAAEAEAEEQGGGVLEQGAGAFKGVGTEGLGVNDDAGSGGSNGSGMVEGVIGGPLGDAQAGGIASGGYAKETSGDAGRKGAAGGGVREEKILEVEKNQGSDEVEREKGKEMVEDDDDAEEGKEFVPDPYMRRGETACRKLQVEGVTPLIRASRASPATCEALAGEETEELLELVNHSGPAISVMEVWARPVQGSTSVASKPSPPPQQQQQQLTTLIFSLPAAAMTTTKNGYLKEKHPGSGGGVGAFTTGVMGSGVVDVTLASPAEKIPAGEAGGVVAPGEGLRLALRLRAGLAGDRDAVTEVLVKYSERAGAPFHRQLKLPLRVGVKGGLRVCSLRVAQFVDGGLTFGCDADATECLLLLELANESAFPIFVWRDRAAAIRRREEGKGTKDVEESEGCWWGIGVTEVNAGAGRCLALRIPRLSVQPETKTAEQDELRSPVALRPLSAWEKSLLKHLRRELSLRWSTSSAEAAAAAASTSAPSASGHGLVPHGDGSSGRCTSWRRGRVNIAMDQLGDDGRCLERYQVGSGSGGRGGGWGVERSGVRGTGPTATTSAGVGVGVRGAQAPIYAGNGGASRIVSRRQRHPDAAPECLLGAILPPVRLTCVPLALAPTGGVGSGIRAGGFNAKDFSEAAVGGAGNVEVVGGKVDVIGGWSAITTVDCFMPVSLVVSNPSPWNVEVDVEVTSRAEGSEESRPWGSDDSDDPAHVMWCGMPRRRLGQLPPGSSGCHGLVACFLTPGDVSIGFTCRIKLAMASSTPFGTPTPSMAGSGLSSKPGVGARSEDSVSEEDSGWHPVMCHLPLKVSVLARPKLGADRDRPKLKVHRVGPRVGGDPAYDRRDDEELSPNADFVEAGSSDAGPAELDRLNGGRKEVSLNTSKARTSSSATATTPATNGRISFFAR